MGAGADSPLVGPWMDNSSQKLKRLQPKRVLPASVKWSGPACGAADLEVAVWLKGWKPPHAHTRPYAYAHLHAG